MSTVVVPPSPIFGYLDVNSFGKFVALVLSNPRHWNLDESIAGGARFLDRRHSTSSHLPPCECLPFLHARMDWRSLTAELHVHRSLHRTRILRLDSTCLRWSLALEDCLFRAGFCRRRIFFFLFFFF